MASFVALSLEDAFPILCKLPVNLIVTGYIDNVYNTADRTGHIRLKIKANSSTGLTGVWDTVNIPDIQETFFSGFVKHYVHIMTKMFKTLCTYNDKDVQNIMYI
jgi:hypothetical protein